METCQLLLDLGSRDPPRGRRELAVGEPIRRAQPEIVPLPRARLPFHQRANLRGDITIHCVGTTVSRLSSRRSWRASWYHGSARRSAVATSANIAIPTTERSAMTANMSAVADWLLRIKIS